MSDRTTISPRLFSFKSFPVAQFSYEGHTDNHQCVCIAVKETHMHKNRYRLEKLETCCHYTKSPKWPRNFCHRSTSLNIPLWWKFLFGKSHACTTNLLGCRKGLFVGSDSWWHERTKTHVWREDGKTIPCQPFDSQQFLVCSVTCTLSCWTMTWIFSGHFSWRVLSLSLRIWKEWTTSFLSSNTIHMHRSTLKQIFLHTHTHTHTHTLSLSLSLSLFLSLAPACHCWKHPQ
jgi:hypothetical protein